MIGPWRRNWTHCMVRLLVFYKKKQKKKIGLSACISMPVQLNARTKVRLFIQQFINNRNFNGILDLNCQRWMNNGIKLTNAKCASIGGVYGARWSNFARTWYGALNLSSALRQMHVQCIGLILASSYRLVYRNRNINNILSI